MENITLRKLSDSPKPFRVKLAKLLIERINLTLNLEPQDFLQTSKSCLVCKTPFSLCENCKTRNPLGLSNCFHCGKAL